MAKNNQGAVGAEIISYDSLRDKIYEIRGQKVMLDYDLAEIYGYTTSAFNQQVTRNAEKFEGEEFMFRLTRWELDFLVMSQNVTSRSSTLFKGQDGGTRKLPYAFTEQGVYMLMTVLRGELAIKQSRALVMAFKAMKDYIIENQAALEYRDDLKIIAQVAEHAKDITEAKHKMAEMEIEVKDLSRKMSDVVTKSEISPIILDFANRPERHEFLFLNGEVAKASEVYQDIYSKAKCNIYIVDNYIGLKTLRHLKTAKSEVEIIIFSDNANKYLHENDYRDFKKELPKINLKLVKTNGNIHDRFIVLDYGTKRERIFHCGASSKDAGGRLMAISEFTESATKQVLDEVIRKMMRVGG